MALSMPCSSSSLSSLLRLLSIGQANISTVQEQEVREVASLLGISMDLQKEQNVQENLEVKQEEVEVANMAVFATRSRESTMSCLPTQPKRNIPNRGKGGRYYPPNWLKCEFCSKSFKKRTYVRLHKHNKHPELVGDNEIACKFCARFYPKQAMFQHVSFKHPNEANGLILRKKVWTFGKLKRNKPTPFHCNLCNKYFTFNNKLTVHMKTHMPKPFVCKTCGCDFTQKMQYKRHTEKYHKDILQCEKSEVLVQGTTVFKQEGQFKIKPYHCEFCQKSFSKTKYLTTHMATHASEKPHNCDVCGRGFAQRTNFVRHMCRENNTSTLLREYSENESAEK